MPRFLFLTLLLALAVAPAVAQTAVVRGFVTDTDDGEPLQGVNVVLLQDGSLLTGVATDRDGLYQIARVDPGTYQLRATFIGYATRTETITLEPGEIRTLSFELAFDEADLDEVIIESEREGAGGASVVAGLQAIQARDIDLVPAPDISGDLAQYLVTIPGVVSVGDQGGQVFVRGGEPTHNLALLDGMPIFQPFHLIGFYSAFPSDIIQVANVYAGGYGSRYGGRISSVMDIASRNGNKNRPEGSISLAPFMSGVLLEGPLVKRRVSVLLSGRTSVIEQGAERLVDDELPYQFDDQFAKIHADLSSGSTLSFIGLRSYDRGIIDPTAASDTTSNRSTVSWENSSFGMRYVLLPTRIPIRAEILLSYATTKNSFGDAGNQRTSASNLFTASVNVAQYFQGIEMRWGGQIMQNELASELGGQFQNVDADREFVTEASAYLETSLQSQSGFRLEPGFRLSSFPSKGQTYLEPRVRAVWELGRHTVSGAVGIYHQEVVGLADRRDAGDVFTAWTSSPSFAGVPEARHAILGYKVTATDWLRMSIEGYYKQLSNLSIPEWTAYPRFTTNLQRADGTAHGADARIEITKGAFYGLFSYGYAEVEYEATQPSLEVWFGSPTLRYNPPHDRRHQVNAMGNLNIVGFNLGVRWQFGSGLPFSQALGFDEFVLVDGPVSPLEEPGDTRVLYQEPYAARLPTYHRLDISLERSFDLGGSRELAVQASAINTYDRANLFYVDLFTLRRLDQLPFIPTLGVKLSF